MGELAEGFIKSYQKLEGYFSSKKGPEVKPAARQAEKVFYAQRNAEQKKWNTDHPLLPFIAEELKNVRAQTESLSKWQKIDFLEKFATARLSAEAARQSYRKASPLREFQEAMQGKKEPKVNFFKGVPRIRFNNPDDHKKFNELWKNFTSVDPKNQVDARSSLANVFEFWKDHAKPFPEVKLHVRPVMRNLIAQPS
jgi:hypothetical protein